MDASQRCIRVYNDTQVFASNFSLSQRNVSCVGGGEGRLGASSLTHVRWITLIFYLITFIVGLFGNSLVIYVIARFKKVRTRSVANYYIFNLAFADLLFILTLPFFCFATYAGKWIFGDVVCRVAFVCYESNKFASVFTLVALSVDRYLATLPTLRSLRTLHVGGAVCVGIWLIGVLICTPLWLYSGVHQRGDVATCQLIWPSHPTLLYQQIWVYSQLCLGLILPLLIIVCSNTLLLTRLRGMPRPGSQRSSSSSNKRSSAMTRTILTVVALFAFCQIPKYVGDVITLRVLLASSRPSAVSTIVFVHFNMVAIILVFVSSCINPLVYGIMNRNYRVLYRQVLCCCLSSWHGNSSDESGNTFSACCRRQGSSPTATRLRGIYQTTCITSEV